MKRPLLARAGAARVATINGRRVTLQRGRDTLLGGSRGVLSINEAGKRLSYSLGGPHRARAKAHLAHVMRGSNDPFYVRKAGAMRALRGAFSRSGYKVTGYAGRPYKSVGPASFGVRAGRAGHVAGRLKRGVMEVTSSYVDASARGKGHGSRLYAGVMRAAKRSGREMRSDSSVSVLAQRRYRALAREHGAQVYYRGQRQAPSSGDRYATSRGGSGDSIFIVNPRKPPKGYRRVFHKGLKRALRRQFPGAKIQLQSRADPGAAAGATVRMKSGTTASVSSTRGRMAIRYTEKGVLARPGEGAQLYRGLANAARGRGQELRSDSVVSGLAQRRYRGLRREGHRVYQAAQALATTTASGRPSRKWAPKFRDRRRRARTLGGAGRGGELSSAAVFVVNPITTPKGYRRMRRTDARRLRRRVRKGLRATLRRLHPMRRARIKVARTAARLRAEGGNETFYRGTRTRTHQLTRIGNRSGSAWAINSRRKANDYAGTSQGAVVMPVKARGRYYDHNNPTHRAALTRRERKHLPRAGAAPWTVGPDLENPRANAVLARRGFHGARYRLDGKEVRYAFGGNAERRWRTHFGKRSVMNTGNIAKALALIEKARPRLSARQRRNVRIQNAKDAWLRGGNAGMVDGRLYRYNTSNVAPAIPRIARGQAARNYLRTRRQYGPLASGHRGYSQVRNSPNYRRMPKRSVSAWKPWKQVRKARFRGVRMSPKQRRIIATGGRVGPGMTRLGRGASSTGGTMTLIRGYSGGEHHRGWPIDGGRAKRTPMGRQNAIERRLGLGGAMRRKAKGRAYVARAKREHARRNISLSDRSYRGFLDD